MISRPLLSSENTWRIINARLLTFTFTYCLFTFSLLHAQWPTTPDSSLLIGYGLFPEIISDGDGGAIVAFEATIPSNEQVIKVKRVDKYGYLQWNGFSGVIAGGTGDEQHEHGIWEDGNGGVFVAFEDRTCIPDCGIPTATIFSKVRVQQIDHAGNKLWGDGIAVTLTDSIRQNEPQVQPDGEGGCIVSWMDNRYSPNPLRYDVYVQRIDSSGNLCWGDSGIALTDSANLVRTSTPFMVVDEEGNTFLMYWDNSGYRVEKYSINGVKLWSNFEPLINQTPALRLSDGNGGVYQASVVSDGNMIRIATQHLNSDGQKQWGEGGVVLVDSVNINQSKVTGLVLNDQQNIFISYYYTQTDSPSVYLQKLTPQGTKLFPENGLSVSNFPSEKWGGGIIKSEDSLLYIWKNGYPAANSFFAQKLDENGNRLWGEDKAIAVFGSFTHDSNGGIITVANIGNLEVVLSKLSKKGIIGEVLTSLITNENNHLSTNFVIYPNYPNPFNSSTVIQFYLSAAAKVKLTIYNLLGQEIKTLIDEKMLAGDHLRVWDGRNDFGEEVASGIYYYRLTITDQSKTNKMILIR